VRDGDETHLISWTNGAVEPPTNCIRNHYRVQRLQYVVRYHRLRLLVLWFSRMVLKLRQR